MNLSDFNIFIVPWCGLFRILNVNLLLSMSVALNDPVYGLFLMVAIEIFCATGG